MNNKGQAMIESLVIGLILITSLFFFLRYALITQQSLLVDEFIEQALICLAENKTSCTVDLSRRLAQLHFGSIRIKEERLTGKAIISLNAISAWGRRLEKESELQLDLAVTK